MDLRQYINSFPSIERRDVISSLALSLEASVAAIRQWMYGIRNPSPSHALQIEKLTNGKVTRYDLRPDIYPREE